MRLSFTVLFSLLSAVVATPIRDTIAPLSATGNTIDNSYIVTFKKGVSPDQITLHLDAISAANLANPLVGDESGVTHVYTPVGVNFLGYAGKFSQATLDEIRRMPEVAHVEFDQIVHTQDEVYGVDDALAGDIKNQIGAPWGLARISHREPLHLSTFNKYTFDGHGGDGVTAYVIDTGVNIEHEEFQGRARWGKTIPRGDRDEDANGHGTHCAGTIGSRKYGVAKGASIVAVKVLGSNGSGTMADVVGGVTWAAESALKEKKAAEEELKATGSTKHKGSVANMSLGGGKSPSLDQAVNEAVDVGLHFAVAAGNDNKDACDYSPASAEKAVTVGASDIGDARAYFSNHGKCVDIFAPGLNIKSTWMGGKNAENTISGTSMASPHICGMLAYLLSIEGSDTFTMIAPDAINLTEMETEAGVYEQAYGLLPEALQQFLPTPEERIPVLAKDKISPKALKKALIALASPGMLTDIPRGTPNLLAFNNATKA